MNILDEIISVKEKEVEERKFAYPTTLLEQSANFKREPISLTKRLKSDNQNGIIAEIKRKSPSRGLINGLISVSELAAGYVQAGASGLSILTDQKFFGGSLADLSLGRQACSCPILRKDFILDEYQIVEAKSYGADVILLIARILSCQEIVRLARFAHSLGLEVLLEIHNRLELEKSPVQEIDLIGVNNRDLSKFTVDISRSIELAPEIPRDICKISESGIANADDIHTLINHGFNGFLIGETFMRGAEPALECQRLVSTLRQKGGHDAAA
jgi:indole-3-glycerol phosphate synthase